MAPGRWVPLDAGDVLRCRCGAVKDGSRVGKRGGRVWVWEIGEGRVCQPRCPALASIEDEIARDEERGDWEAQQAQERYG